MVGDAVKPASFYTRASPAVALDGKTEGFRIHMQRNTSGSLGDQKDFLSVRGEPIRLTWRRQRGTWVEYHVNLFLCPHHGCNITQVGTASTCLLPLLCNFPDPLTRHGTDTDALSVLSLVSPPRHIWERGFYALSPSSSRAVIMLA